MALLVAFAQQADIVAKGLQPQANVRRANSALCLVQVPMMSAATALLDISAGVIRSLRQQDHAQKAFTAKLVRGKKINTQPQPVITLLKVRLNHIPACLARISLLPNQHLASRAQQAVSAQVLGSTN
jgi:hypothetical protein